MSAKSRLRESATTLAAIGAVIALSTGLIVGTVAYLDQQGTHGIQTELSTRVGADLALRASLSRGTKPGRQDAQVRSAITASFAGSHLDVAVTRSLDSHVTIRVVADPANEDRGGSAQSIPDFADRVDLVAGTTPSTSKDVAVQVDAARELGLSPGDEVLVAGVRFTVCGTWKAKDLLDPRWYGDPMVATGFDDDLGPFVLIEDAWGRLDVNPTVTWTLVPRRDQIDAANIDEIIGAWAGIRDDWRPSVDGLETLTFQNRLIQTLRGVDARLAGLRAVEPVVFSLITAAALVGLAELVRLLVSTRRRITALYWARGDSRRGIVGRAARDVGFAGVAGAVIGAGVAATIVVALAGTDVLLGIGWTAGAAPAVILAGAIVIALVSSRPDRVSRGRIGRDAGRRARRAALPGIVVLMSLAAVLSVWQLQLYGSPLTPTVDGTGEVDPIAVLAPALGLSAAVLLCVLAFPRISALNERRVRQANVTTQLAARGIVLRPGLVLAPLVLMALAVGSTTVAAAYSATWDVAFGQTAALRAGSDLHASARIEGITPAAQDAARQVSGVDAVAPIEIQPLTVGSESGTILGAAPDAVAQLATDADGRFDPAEAAGLLADDIPGPVLPGEASGFTLTVEAKGFVDPPVLSAYLSDGMGFLRQVDLALGAPDADPESLTYSAEDIPPPAEGSWRIDAIDLRFAEQDFDAAPADLHLTRLDVAAGGAMQPVPLDQFWIADSPGLRVQPPTTDGRGSGLFLAGDTSGARLTPSLSGTVDDRAQPPVLVSQQLADRFDIEVGDPLAFSVQDGIERLNCTVAGIVAAVPGAPTEAAVLIDLGVIQHFQLRTTATPAYPRDLWVTADDPEAVASALRTAIPANARIDSALDPVGRQIMGSAAIALWAAAGGIVLLALAGIASSAGARLRSGRNDIAVLRALGLTVRDQARIPSGELRAVLVLGAVAGLIAGCVVAVLTVPYFARAAVTMPYLSISTGLRADPWGWLGLIAVLGVGATAIVLFMRRRVAGLVRNAMPGEGAE